MPSSSHQNASLSLNARRRSLFWRIHVWAALIASPFAVIAALTGILYVFTPQIEHALYGSLLQVTPGVERRSLDAAARAAQAAVPSGYTLRTIAAPYRADDSVQLTFFPDATQGGGDGHHVAAAPIKSSASAGLIVFVNPYTARVLGQLDEAERFSHWSSTLHSTLLQGPSWRWMIELAASWLMVMLLTGVYLWWPRATRKAAAPAGARGRKAWSRWHGYVGVALSLISFTVLTTGLTWSRYAGEQIRSVRDRIGQAPPRAPKHLASAHAASSPLGWQAAWAIARRHAPNVRLQLTAPRGAHGVWKASSFDRSQPRKRFDLILDAYRGTTLYYADWNQQTAFSKATAIGIPFHRGEFGWWNQALLLLFGAGLLFSLLSGWMMVFKRRRAGAPILPRLLPGAWRSVPPPALITAAVLLALLPVLLISTALLLGLEIVLARKLSSSPSAAL